MHSTRDIAAAYFASWAAQDYDALRGVLDDDVSFRGPLGSADGAEACVRGLRGLAEGVGLPEVRVIATDGDDAVTWFDLRTADGAIPVANWSHVDNGRITRIRVAFDPRPLVG
jgi:ketosteroid isomerase-like protein